MSQPATANAVPGGQQDNYSIYSYSKQGIEGIGSDTLRSTAIDSLRTQTLQSTQSRASPQYRVSDIDPDFARRFREDNHTTHY